MQSDIDYVGMMLSAAQEANERIQAKQTSATFDLDLEEFGEESTTKTPRIVRDKRDLDGVAVFQARMSYLTKKREEQSARARVNAKKELELISSVDDVDDIDRRTPWKKMDTWMKKTRLRAFAKKLASQSGREQSEIEVLVLDLYQRGKLKKPGVVEYCLDAGEIVNLHLNEITEMNLHKG
jgi:hypothetical protein